MSEHRGRYRRQMRVPEIGEEGQARLAASAVMLGGQGYAREIEDVYLRFAGVGIASSDQDQAARAPCSIDVASLGIEHVAAREVAEGAMRALVTMRCILGV